MTTGTITRTIHGYGHRERVVQGLYDNHAAALKGYVTALLEGDRQSAEDVVQETVVRAWRHAETLDESGEAFRPWLLKVARRLVIDRYRQRVSRPAEIGGDVPDRLAATDESERALASLVVSDALEALSPAHREVLVAVYYRGNTLDEAARLLGVPTGTVKSRIYYALRALRHTLERRGLTAADAC
jgi:RNA polymerase sigma-70 factor (ECF subfamily)